MVELTITIKGNEQTYKQKFLTYEPFQMTDTDPYICQCIAESMSNAKIDPEDLKIKVRAALEVQ